MASPDDPQAELLRRFEAAVSGSELADLRRLAGDVGLVDGRLVRRTTRPELRRPRLGELRILRVRVDLDHADPPIWRRLDLRSDLTLDVVHHVLQVAFSWMDSHLHRFALGGQPFDPTSQVFLCPSDIEEGEDEGGVPATDVRLDETLREPGDVLTYVYDYGDSWELTLRLEESLPATSDAQSAVAVDGRRAAPPEDSGGIVDEASLALVVDDPAHFDLEAVNLGLRDAYFLLREHSIDERLLELINRLRYTALGDDLARRARAVVEEPTRPENDELVASLRGYTWFVDRAAGGGIELTSAGYLRPHDVEAASSVVPAMGDWYGKKNREVNAVPLLEFRESLRRLGLLRKHRGRLVLTRLGQSVAQQPQRLWDLIAEALVPTTDGFETDATLLLLHYAASSADSQLPVGMIAAALTELGWRREDGRPLEPYEIYRLPAVDVLRNINDRMLDHRSRRSISPAAAALARTALRAS